MRSVLRREFYERSAVSVARDLIGKEIVRKIRLGSNGLTRLRGRIVEAEAYGGSDDAASHAFRGKTRRNEALFGEAGHVYVYFTYGAHYCLNFVTTSDSVGAVLIRAIEPLEGIEIMAKFRGTSNPYSIGSGPGKICQALSIDLRLNNVDLTNPRSPLTVLAPASEVNERIASSPRIGITKAISRKWRFFFSGSPFVSRIPKS